MFKRVLIFVLVFTFLLSTTCQAAEKKIKQICWGTTDDIVCLTFDDGYGTKYIESILKTLKKYDINCTFFIVGDALKNNKKLWQQAIKDGHEICYHSMHHPTNITKMTNDEIQADLDEWINVAHDVLGDDYIVPKYVRLPGGNANDRVLKFFDDQGYKAIYWSDEVYTSVIRNHTKDSTSKVGTLIARHVIKNTKDTSIVLLHFDAVDANSLPKILKKISTKFNFDTISNSLTEKPAT